MKKTLYMCSLAMMSLALIGLTGCASKSVQSGGDSSAQAPAKAGSAESGAPSGSGSFPSTGVQPSGSGLRGFDKSPSEERVESGMMLAKVDPSASVARQMDDLRAEQVASAAAGLRDVFFAYDSWAISEEGRQALTRSVEWIKSNSSAQVKIEGHCDERGTSAYNLVLGEKRAKAVRNYLVELGIGANRLSVVSYGKEQPSCSEHAESCYQQNRRGHLVVKSGK